MNHYSLNLLALAIAIFGQAIACGLCAELALSRSRPRFSRLSWAMLAAAAALLALHHGYSLELAMRTGLYDLRQSLLAAVVALLGVLALFGLRQQA